MEGAAEEEPAEDSVVRPAEEGTLEEKGSDTGVTGAGGGGVTSGVTAPEITAGGVYIGGKLLHCIAATDSGRRLRLRRTSRVDSETKASLNSVDATVRLMSTGAPTRGLTGAGAACAVARVN